MLDETSLSRLALFRFAFEGLPVQHGDCGALARAYWSHFRIQVVQSPHLRDQLCQVTDVDEDIMASTPSS